MRKKKPNKYWNIYQVTKTTKQLPSDDVELKIPRRRRITSMLN